MGIFQYAPLAVIVFLLAVCIALFFLPEENKSPLHTQLLPGAQPKKEAEAKCVFDVCLCECVLKGKTFADLHPKQKCDSGCLAQLPQIPSPEEICVSNDGLCKFSEGIQVLVEEIKLETCGNNVIDGGEHCGNCPEDFLDEMCSPLIEGEE